MFVLLKNFICYVSFNYWNKLVNFTANLCKLITILKKNIKKKTIFDSKKKKNGNT